MGIHRQKDKEWIVLLVIIMGAIAVISFINTILAVVLFIGIAGVSELWKKIRKKQSD